MDLNEAPKDIIYEIFKKCNYTTSIKFLQANRKIYEVSCQAKSMIDEKLLDEVMRKNKNNIQMALIKAVEYNNITIVNRLLGDCIKITCSYLIRGIKASIDNKNETIGKLLISKIDHRFDEWDLSRICDFLVEKRQFNLIEYILEAYPQYLNQSTIIYLIKSGRSVPHILKQLPNLKETSYESIIVMLLAYQDIASLDQIGNINYVGLRRFIESNDNIAKDLLKRYETGGSRLKLERNENATAIVIQLLKSKGYQFDELNIERRKLIEAELEHLTVAELRILADKEGFAGLSKYKKAELVEMMTEIQLHRPIFETLTQFKLRRIAEILYIPKYIEMTSEELIASIRDAINA